MNIIFLFYEGMTALDAVGPHEILCRLPGVSVYPPNNPLLAKQEVPCQ